jgi:hypothetical protein
VASVNHIGLFPFCITSPESDINAIFKQMTMTKELGMVFWWRVKNYRVDSAQLTVGPDDSGNFGEISMPTGQMTLELPSEGISSEKNLVCDITRQFGVSLPFPNNVAVDLRIFPGANQSGSLIKMHMDVRCTLQTTQYFSGNGATPDPYTLGDCTISVLGEDLTFPIGGDFSGSASLEISASEYWPYDPGDGGGPIYDSATGAQIRSFP